MATTILALISSVLIGLICMHYAQQRGRYPAVWFVLGALFGLFGLIALLILPRVKQEESIDLVDVEKPLEPVEPVAPDPRYQTWFYVDQSRTAQGPVPFRRLFFAWRDQLISRDSLVWTEGMPQWQPICQLPNLLDKLN